MAVYQEKSKKKWTKDGRKWYFRIYKDGKQHESKMFGSKKEAEEAEALELLDKDCSLKKPFKLMAKGYFDELSTIRKESTYYTYEKDYKRHIKPFFEKYNDISKIKVTTIKKWADEMNKKNIATEYKNKNRNILKGIFDYAIRNYNLESNPVVTFGYFKEKNDKVITDEEKIRYITFDEFKQFISVVEDDLWKAFFTFAYYTGCRKGEMLALTWKDIDFNNNIITINKTLYVVKKGKKSITNTKNCKNRKVKMSNCLSECMTHYKNKVSEYSNFNEGWYVFGNEHHLSKSTIQRKRINYFKLSKVHDITLHEFRHSHVSLLINEYVKTSKVKQMKIDTAKFFLMMSNRLGHTVPVMQKTYMHLFPTIQDEIVDLLDNL